MKSIFLVLFILIYCYQLSFSQYDNYENLNRCKIIKNHQPYSINKNNTIQSGCPNSLQVIISTPDNKFYIHYDTTGHYDTTRDNNGNVVSLRKSNNQIDLTDNNKNGIPDYIDSVSYYLEYIYNQYINVWGYDDPTDDAGQNCTPGLDVYIEELGDTINGTGGGYYGYTQSMEARNRNLNNYVSYYTSLHIDNNYSPNDLRYDTSTKTYLKSYVTTGFDALKITIAHEFYHTLHFLYGDGNNNLFPEMSAVFMEWRFFPEITDYQQYTRRLLRSINDTSSTSINSLSNQDPTSGYRFAVFMQMLYKKYGDSIHIKLWKRMDESNQCLIVLNNVLKDYNSTLDIEWCDFMNWIYHTGLRAEYIGNSGQTDKYLYHAKELPDLKFDFENELANNFDTARDSSSTYINMKPYTFSGIRTIFKNSDFKSQDTFDIMIANKNFTKALNSGSYLPDIYYYSITENASYAFARIDSSRFYYNIDFNSNTDYCTANYLKLGDTTEAISTAFPNPYRNTDGEIYFPTPAGSKIYDDISLAIFNTDMTAVYSELLKVQSFPLKTQDGINGIRCIRLEKLPSSMTSGAYVFRVSTLTNSILGKFSVIK